MVEADKLMEWANKWKLEFNAEKCEELQPGRGV